MKIVCCVLQKPFAERQYMSKVGPLLEWFRSAAEMLPCAALSARLCRIKRVLQQPQPQIHSPSSSQRSTRQHWVATTSDHSKRVEYRTL